MRHCTLHGIISPVKTMFNKPHQECFVPSGEDTHTALARTTHLAIAAHQDDIEIMAIDGILKCYQNPRLHFSACTVTDGRGTPRTGPFGHLTDEEMAQVRHEEQKEAARVGGYSAQVLLGYRSAQARAGNDISLAEDLDDLLRATQARVIYTHNLLDKHRTHVAVALRVIEAVRRLPPSARPEKLYGCEVWRSLDFLPGAHKVIFDVSAHADLQSDLLRVFQSQIAGGKNYEEAVIGRRLANATFLDAYAPDEASRLSFAMDLSPLVQDDQLSPTAYVQDILATLSAEISRALDSPGE